MSQFEIGTLLVGAKHQQSQAVLLIAVAGRYNMRPVDQLGIMAVGAAGKRRPYSELIA